jgi:DNA modification methylase
MINEAPRYCNMRLVTHEDFLKFCKDHEYVIIDDQRVPIGNKWSITSYGPESYSPEKETVWSFPRRGDWATHIGNYRGNWSPFIPRNLIERFTNRGDLVLDQMVGSGTTLVECKLLGRNGIGVDINPDAIMVTRDRLNFSYHPIREGYVEPRILTFVGDARNLDELEDESVDLIATHPPYASIIRFSGRRVQGDLSSLIELEDYLAEIRIVADESMRVLKPGKHCAVLIGDTRKHKHYVPIAMRVMQEFLNAGFVLRENVVKIQWNAKATREKWKGQELDFYRIAHEHLFIFRKVPIAKEIRKLRLSSRWW